MFPNCLCSCLLDIAFAYLTVHLNNICDVALITNLACRGSSRPALPIRDWFPPQTAVELPPFVVLVLVPAAFLRCPPATFVGHRISRGRTMVLMVLRTMVLLVLLVLLLVLMMRFHCWPARWGAGRITSSA